MILKVTLFVMWVLGVQYGEELILNVTLFVMWVLGVQYGEELILNVTVCFEVLWRAIYSGNFAEYHSIGFEKLERAM